ncbi:hypothetical protein VTK56DRAFT_5934 [Thermocarpiscus australiensis]
MKYTLPITLLAAAASVDASAVAVLTGEDKRWCNNRGQACDTVKRAADAFVEALKSTGPLARDETSSESAFMAKRQVDELAMAIAASQADPTAYYTSLSLGQHFTPADDKEKRDPQWCTRFPGQPCWKEKRDPEAQWCTRFPGQPCWKEKREPDPQWCTRFPGQPCWKRDAAPEPAAYGNRYPGHAAWARAATPEAEEDHRRCVSEGQSCWKARRAAEAVVNTIEAEGAYRAKREADPQLCLRFPGQSCWKREASPAAACNSPDGVCTKATRDLHAMYNLARTILESN